MLNFKIFNFLKLNQNTEVISFKSSYLCCQTWNKIADVNKVKLSRSISKQRLKETMYWQCPLD